MMRITKLKHIQTVHADINDADCPHCIRRFHSARAFENHLKEHQMTPQFLCGTCGKVFHRRAFLTEHVKTHDPNYKFICDYCGFSSGRKVTFFSNFLFLKALFFLN
jgi:transcription elongation factor Elf1